MISIHSELYWQIRAFLRTFEDDCKSCFRDKTMCLTCRNARAVAIAKDLDAKSNIASSVKFIDAPRFKYLRLMAEIYAQIAVSPVPITAREIKIECSRSFKEWILKKLIILGRITRQKKENSTQYTYTAVKGAVK